MYSGLSRFYLTCLLVLVGSFAFGQKLDKNPVAQAALNIGQSGLGAGKDGADPLSFKPVGGHEMVKVFADSVGTTAEEKKALTDALIEGLKSFREVSKQLGAENDASVAMAYGIATLYSVAKGTELDDVAFLTLIPRLRGTMDVESVRKATDAQKEEFFEFAVCSGNFVLMMVEARGAEKKDQWKPVAAAMLKNLIGADVDQISLKGESVSIKGQPKTPSPDDRVEKGTAPGFSAGRPDGWVQSGPWLVRTLTENRGGGEELRLAMVRYPDAVPAKGNMGDALRAVWKRDVPATLDGRYGGMVYRRYVGEGLFSQFIFGAGREEGRRSDTMFMVFLVDCGSTWQPVVFALTYEDRGTIRIAEERMAQSSFSETAPLCEEILATLRCPGVKKQAICGMPDLAGDYSFGSSSNMQYANIYTGATTMSFVSYGGTLNLLADGSFTYRYASASGVGGATTFGGIKAAGKWTIEGDLLVLKYSSYDQGDSYTKDKDVYKIAGLVAFGDGTRVAVLLDDERKIPNCISMGDSGDWYSTKKK